MSITLFDDQQNLKDGVYYQWLNGSRACVAVLPTGGGKSYTLASIVADAPGYVIVFAHRDVLIEQLSVSLAEMGIYHSFICSNSARTGITNTHYEKFKKSFYDDTGNALVFVASVDTFIAWAKAGKLPDWIPLTGLAVFDEAHHVLGPGKGVNDESNKWGRCAALMPDNCKILGMTATPCRSDRKGLGVHNHGIFDSMVIGPDMRILIDKGRLCEYRLLVPPQARQVRLDAKKLRVTGKGDYSQQQATALVDTATITGDVVKTYLKHTGGKVQGITFAASIEHANHLAKAFNDAGVAAASISSKTKSGERKKLVKAFRAGELMQLVNVDLFGEGFDVPAIYCVSFVRPTLSYSLYMQHFGRALRVLPGKDYALIFDHVANVYEHGLPDHGRPWTLDAPVKKTKNVQSDYTLITCQHCDFIYELPAKCCPVCEGVPEVGERNMNYATSDDELVELTSEEIEQLRGKRNQHGREHSDVLNGMLASGSNPMVAHSVANNHDKRKQAQYNLRNTMNTWWQHTGLDVEQARAQFHMIFKTDVHNAQVLSSKESELLTHRVLTHMHNTFNINAYQSLGNNTQH